MIAIGVGVIVVLFILGIWWLAWHPDWGLSRQPEILRDPPRRYGSDDPGAIATEVELR